MSSQHETVARRIVEEVWNHGKLDALDQLVTPDVAGHDPMNPAKGIEGFRDVVRKYRTAFPDLRQEIKDVFSSGDKVALRVVCTGTHRGPLEGIAPTGKPVNITGIVISRFSGDRVAEAYVNMDTLGLMQQLGVVTMPGKATSARA